MDEWGDTPTTKPHHEHDDLYVWVSVAVFLAILIMLGSWFWGGSAKLFPEEPASISAE